MRIYDIADTTDDETFWPLGFFATKEEAESAVNGGPSVFGNPVDRDECIVIEIRERESGWNPMHTGKTVSRRVWNLNFPEDGDSFWEEVK